MEAQVRTASHSASHGRLPRTPARPSSASMPCCNPRNIVLVGATDKPGNYAERIWNNLIKYQYEGGLYPVNSKRETIWGVPCYKDFASLPEKNRTMCWCWCRPASPSQVIRPVGDHCHLGVQRVAGRR